MFQISPSIIILLFWESKIIYFCLRSNFPERTTLNKIYYKRRRISNSFHTITDKNHYYDYYYDPFSRKLKQSLMKIVSAVENLVEIYCECDLFFLKSVNLTGKLYFLLKVLLDYAFDVMELPQKFSCAILCLFDLIRESKVK